MPLGLLRQCSYCALLEMVLILRQGMLSRLSESDRAAARFFSPEMTIWRIDREMALLLGGGRALLMQLAHPKVAAGVADYSHFHEDPLGRLYRTMNTMWSIVFDQESEEIGRAHV